MAVPTRSSNGRPAANARARISVVLGLVAAAALPATIALAETSDLLELPEAAVAIPVAAVLGVCAVVLARRARIQVQRTLGRVGGERTARLGRALGLLALGLAVAGAIAVGFNEYLQRFYED